MTLLLFISANAVYANNTPQIEPLSESIDKDLYGEKHIVVSLGDSFSSGEGNPPFYGQYEDFEDRINGTNYDWITHRSTYCWPGKLFFPGSDTELKEWKDKDTQENEGWYFAASSGAVTTDLWGEQDKPYRKTISYDLTKSEEVYKKYLNALLLNYKSDYYEVLSSPNILIDGSNPHISVRYAGNRKVPPQLSIFNNITQNETDFVTMTMGGNDTGFSTIVECAYKIGAKKNFDYANPNSLFSKISNTIDHFDDEGGIRDSLKKSYYEVAKAAGYQANIIIAGYPRLINKSGGMGFDSGEAIYIDNSVDYFNDRIEELVSECADEGLNIFFCDVVSGFENHEACTKNRYIHTVMLPAREEDLDETSISSSYSMHPNEKGTQVYAEYVQEVLNGVANDLKKYRLGLEESFMNSEEVEGDVRKFYFGDFNCDGHYEGFGISGTSAESSLNNTCIYYIDSCDSIEKIATFDKLYGYDEIDSTRIIYTGSSYFLLVGGFENQPISLFGVRNIDEDGKVISTRHLFKEKTSTSISIDYSFKNTSAEAYRPQISGRYTSIQSMNADDSNICFEAQNDNGIDKLVFDKDTAEFSVVSSEANIEVTDYLNNLSELANIINVSYSADKVSLGISGDALEVGPYGVHNEYKQNLKVYGIKIGDGINSTLEKLGKEFCVAVWNRDEDGATLCYFDDDFTNCDFRQRFLRFYTDDSGNITEWTLWTFIPESSLNNEEFEILKFLDLGMENGIYNYENDIKSILEKQVAEKEQKTEWQQPSSECLTDDGRYFIYITQFSDGTIKYYEYTEGPPDHSFYRVSDEKTAAYSGGGIYTFTRIDGMIRGGLVETSENDFQNLLNTVSGLDEINGMFTLVQVENGNISVIEEKWVS